MLCSRAPADILPAARYCTGAFFIGDVVMVAMDRRSVSFMHSFRNCIPLNAVAVQRITDVVTPAFDARSGTISQGLREGKFAPFACDVADEISEETNGSARCGGLNTQVDENDCCR